MSRKAVEDVALALWASMPGEAASDAEYETWLFCCSCVADQCVKHCPGVEHHTFMTMCGG